MAYGEWAPYVPVAKRRAKAAKEMEKLARQGMKVEPIAIEGRKITRTFWGNAWCDHLEKFSDYANRLPRGRTYVRNGSVCHLAISKGKIEAVVSGSELYNVNIKISALAANKWAIVRKQCAGQIGSMLELLQGRFSDNVMAIVTDKNKGLFPKPTEIKLACNCPDWAGMCKHIAAVMYGIGARLDHQPELLFLLRNVDHEALISAELELPSAATGKSGRRRLAASDLSDVFGVDMDEAVEPVRKKSGIGVKTGAQSVIKTKKKAGKKSARKAVKKKAVAKTLSKVLSKTSSKTPSKTNVKAKVKIKAFTPTAAAVTQLRKRFGMNVSQFARLLGVSAATVNRWENDRGKLNLRQHTLDALTQVAEFTPEQATGKLALTP